MKSKSTIFSFDMTKNAKQEIESDKLVYIYVL